MTYAILSAEELSVLLHLAEDQWETLKPTTRGGALRATIKDALAAGHEALQKAKALV